MGFSTLLGAQRPEIFGVFGSFGREAPENFGIFDEVSEKMTPGDQKKLRICQDFEKQDPGMSKKSKNLPGSQKK